MCVVSPSAGSVIYICSSSLLYTRGEGSANPSISFAQTPILIFKEKLALLWSGGTISNFTLFLQNHKDQIVHPKISFQSFHHFRRFIKPFHSAQKFPQFLYRTPRIPHQFSTSIQMPQENEQVISTWEFDSTTRLQNGQKACWGVMIPFSNNMSLVLSFSKCANQTVSCALGGV